MEKKTYVLTLNSEDRNNAYTPTTATYVVSLTNFTGSIAGNQLSVTVQPTGVTLGPGSVISGSGVTPCYIVSGTSSPYTLNISQTIASQTLSVGTGLTSPYTNQYSSPSIPTGYSARNNATFTIDWANFLPREYTQYKVWFNFQSTGGNYKDTAGSTLTYSAAKIFINFGCRSFTYDTGSKGGSLLLGMVQRDIQTTTSASNTFSCYYTWNPPKSISRPESNIITVQIVNPANTVAPNLLYDTNTSGSTVAVDCTPYTMLIEFVPLDNDVVFN